MIRTCCESIRSCVVDGFGQCLCGEADRLDSTGMSGPCGSAQPRAPTSIAEELHYMGYYHRSRTHLGLGKDAPERRGIMRQGEIIGIPQVGGLHHRYERRVA